MGKQTISRSLYKGQAEIGQAYRKASRCYRNNTSLIRQSLILEFGVSKKPDENSPIERTSLTTRGVFVGALGLGS